jgi:hypothetical protein
MQIGLFFSVDFSLSQKRRGEHVALHKPLVYVGTRDKILLSNTRMKILRVIGFGLLIVTVRVLTPTLFHGFESTLLALFQTINHILSLAQDSTTLLASPISIDMVPK